MPSSAKPGRTPLAGYTLFSQINDQHIGCPLLHIAMTGPSRFRILIAMGASLCWAGCCCAGGSWYVDDAGIAPHGHCQLESWWRSFQDGTMELTTVPACSAANVEWSLGMTRLSDPVHSDFTPGVKWQVKDNDHGGFGLALAASSLFHDGRSRNTTVYVAPTWVFGVRQQWEVNTNAGVFHQPGERTQGFAGAAIQYTPSATIALLAEHVWRQAHGHVSQVGMRLALAPSTTLDLVAGRSRDRVTSRWATLGLNLAF
jgi:hypothetical protein